MTSRREALLVGIDQYDDRGLASLRSSVRSAKKVAAVLGDREIGDFTTEVLRNPPEAALRRRIEHFFQDRRSDDLLLFYFAGHGLAGGYDNRLYLAARDTEIDHVRSTATPATFLAEEVNGSRAGQIVLILDCCHAARILDENIRGVDDDLFASFPDLDRGRAVLTASDRYEYAYETSTGSYLTEALVEGLAEGLAAGTDEELISLDRLVDFAQDRFRNRPKPQRLRWRINASGPIYLARNPRAVAASPSVPPVPATVPAPRAAEDAIAVDPPTLDTGSLQSRQLAAADDLDATDSGTQAPTPPSQPAESARHSGDAVERSVAPSSRLVGPLRGTASLVVAAVIVLGFVAAFMNLGASEITYRAGHRPTATAYGGCAEDAPCVQKITYDWTLRPRAEAGNFRSTTFAVTDRRLVRSLDGFLTTAGDHCTGYSIFWTISAGGHRLASGTLRPRSAAHDLDSAVPAGTGSLVVTAKRTDSRHCAAHLLWNAASVGHDTWWYW